MSGTLFVVSTPLGNLEDITLRAIRVLKEVDLIAAEDTRHSRPLLNHYGIKTKVVSYHQHSKRSRVPFLLESLATADVALISDAGTPSLCDPGFELIQAAVAAGISVDVLPGASAVTTAVALAALPARGFIFLGFLPRKKSEMLSRLRQVAALPYALVIFEAPHRLVSTLSTIGETLGDRTVVACKELSKVHQAAVRGKPGQVAELIGEEPRGEWTLVLAPSDESDPRAGSAAILSAVEELVHSGESSRDAVSIAAEALGVSRSDAYRIWIRRKNEKVDPKR